MNQRSDIDRLKSLTTEAETYRSQGLLEEAKEKYLELLEYVKSNDFFSVNKSLTDAIVNKIQLIEDELTEVELDVEIPNLSESIQNLINDLFSFSDNKDIAAIEGSVALAKFGQFQKAFETFEKLTDEGIRIGKKQDIEEISKHFKTMIKYLRDSQNDIKEQSIQLIRYAKDLTQSYNRLKEEEGLREKLSRYVGRNVLDKLISSKDDFMFENERREVTVLFADIRSFTSISERMLAEEVVHMLNEYFTAMVDVIFKNNGILDKFVGDEIMATFGLLSSDENPPYHNAVKTALEMQAATEKLMKSRALSGKETFQIGIGINTGNAIVGNVGSRNRMDYTVIGDCVNTAARLQGLAEGGEIIVGFETYERIKDQFQTKKKGKIKLKNKKQPFLCYKVLR